MCALVTGVQTCALPIYHAIHGPAMARLEPGCIDKNELFVFARQHAVDTVARGLSLTRHDGNFAAYQRIGKRGLAHIGATNACDKAAKEGICHLFSCETAPGRES